MNSNNSKVIVDSRRQSDWIVPRRVMCAFFWVGIILVFTGIILLVTSKHKTARTLYTSTGAILLGLGFCLLLVCLILCMHAYCVITVAEEEPQFRRHVPPPTPPVANGRKPGQNRPNEGSNLLPKHVGGRPVQLIIIEKDNEAIGLASKPPTGKGKLDSPHSPHTSTRSSASSGKYTVETEGPPLYSSVKAENKTLSSSASVNRSNGSAITPNGPVRHIIEPRSPLTPPRHMLNRLTPPEEEEEENEVEHNQEHDALLKNQPHLQEAIQTPTEIQMVSATPPSQRRDINQVTNPSQKKTKAPSPSEESPYHFQPIRSKGSNGTQPVPVRLTTIPHAPPQKACISDVILEEDEDEDYDDTPPPIPPRITSVTQSHTNSSAVASAPHTMHNQPLSQSVAMETITAGDMYLGSTKHVSGGASQASPHIASHSIGPNMPYHRQMAEVYHVSAMPQGNPWQGSMYVTPVTSVENHYSIATTNPSLLSRTEPQISHMQAAPGSNTLPTSMSSTGEIVREGTSYPTNTEGPYNQDSVVFIGPNSELTASKMSVYDNVQYVWTDTPPTRTLYRPIQRLHQKYTF